jgi:hypothetical protein
MSILVDSDPDLFPDLVPYVRIRIRPDEKGPDATRSGSATLVICSDFVDIFCKEQKPHFHFPSELKDKSKILERPSLLTVNYLLYDSLSARLSVMG